MVGEGGLVDPDHAPSAEEMAFALRTIVDATNTATAAASATPDIPKPPWASLLDEAQAALEADLPAAPDPR